MEDASDNTPKTIKSAASSSAHEGRTNDAGDANRHEVKLTSPSRGQNDLFREVALVSLRVDLIDDAPRRVRRALNGHDEDVMRAIKRFGFRCPILVRSKPGGKRYQVIDGHSRLAAARILDAESIPCIVVDDLPEAEVRRLALSLNKLQESGQWDTDMLRLEINEIIEISGDLEIPGFEIPEIDLMLQNVGIDETDTDPLDDLTNLSPARGSPVTLSGDVWIAGNHRVICGPAQDLADLGHIVGSDGAAMVITDPPYNVPVSGHVSTVPGKHAEFAQASGEMSVDDFTNFLVSTLGPTIAALQPGGIAHVFMDWRHQWEIISAFRMLGVELINLAIWVKSAPGMGSLYRSQHELVFVVRKPGAPHRNNVQLGRFGRNRSNVWEYAGATSGNTDEDDFAAHPTVKPVKMIRDAILDVSVPGDVVLDCFLGSGTTLIAAETSHRHCLGVEIEPVYVDLALRRWMALTGRDVVHAASGETFAQVAERRAIKLLPAPGKEFTDG